ncbi:hypothetical protein [Pajaroellobacter abortibovis]|uniref:Transmembrane protein n=1 Tax=Pajaroellobacter abortibovis TaxID=1882918 RepID=A0A1L6MWR8_9BACT|nr:hypothetical protein [Pajaroellobacter abortibovis]APR99904.1 hypothetical protein BCY86_03825 [Pajaroellobacter abortibovis]
MTVAEVSTQEVPASIAPTSSSVSSTSDSITSVREVAKIPNVPLLVARAISLVGAYVPPAMVGGSVLAKLIAIWWFQ